MNNRELHPLNTIILAAGFGTRLGDFGKETPKGLITDTEGKTLLERMLNQISHISELLSTILVTNGLFANAYQKWINQFQELNIQVISNGITKPEDRLGAIGDLLQTIEQLELWENDILVLPSDTYFEGLDIQDFIAFAQQHSDGLVTIVRDMESTDPIKNRLGCAVLDESKITQFVEKPENPPSTFAAIPFYYYPQSLLPKLKTYKESGGSMDAPGSIIPWFLNNEIPVYAYVITGKTIDVGTMNEVNELKNI